MRRAIIALCIVGVVFASLPLFSSADDPIVGFSFFNAFDFQGITSSSQNKSVTLYFNNLPTATIHYNGNDYIMQVYRIQFIVKYSSNPLIQIYVYNKNSYYNTFLWRTGDTESLGAFVLNDGKLWENELTSVQGDISIFEEGTSYITQYIPPIIPNQGVLLPGKLKVEYYDINPSFKTYYTSNIDTPVSYNPVSYDNTYCTYDMSFDIPVLYEIDGKKYIYNGSTNGIYLSIAGADPPINNNNPNATTAARTVNGEAKYHVSFSATAGGSTDVSRVDWNFLAEIAWEAYDQTSLSIPLDNFTIVVTYKEATIDDVIGAINDLIAREQQGNGKLDIISGKLDDLGEIYNAVEDNTDVLQDILSALDDLELNLELDQVQSSGLFALINTAQDLDEQILASRGKLPRQLTENEQNNVNNAMNNASTNLGSLLQEAASDVSPLRYLIQRTFGLPIIGSVLFILIIFGLTLWLLKRGED